MVQIRHDTESNFKFIWSTEQKDVRVALGMSIRDEEGKIFDLPLQVGNLNDLQVPMWWLTPTVDLDGPGVYAVRCSVWKELTEPLQTRLADTGWIENAFQAIEV